MEQEAKKLPKRRCSWINHLWNQGQLKLTPLILLIPQHLKLKVAVGEVR
jgi:hypothetical protein